MQGGPQRDFSMSQQHAKIFVQHAEIFVEQFNILENTTIVLSAMPTKNLCLDYNLFVVKCSKHKAARAFRALEQALYPSRKGFCASRTYIHTQYQDFSHATC